MSELTKIHITEDEKKSAIMSAYRATMSPHEWAWTDREQVVMAQYILWQSTRIAVLERVFDEAECTQDGNMPNSNLLKAIKAARSGE